MRFRKRVKIIPGFYLNFSNSGISSTIGIRGASISFSKKGTYLNTGIPGTGIHNRQRIGGQHMSHEPLQHQYQPQSNPGIRQQDTLIGEIKSVEANELTSASLLELKETLNEVYNDRIELAKEIRRTQEEIQSAKTKHTIARVLVIGFFLKSLKNNIIEKQEYLLDLENQLKNSFVNIDVAFEKPIQEKYESLLNAYKTLLTTQIIWDITSAFQQDMKAMRSAASTVITRKPVRFKFDSIEIIKSVYPALHFENKNGGDLFIYPAFIIMTNNRREFALIDINDFELNFSAQRFIEEEKIPSDTVIIDKTWAKVNKNGSPDKRFSGNYQIPIVRYGQIDIKSRSGLNESYAFSSYEKAQHFAQAFNDFQKKI